MGQGGENHSFSFDLIAFGTILFVCLLCFVGLVSCSFAIRLFFFSLKLFAIKYFKYFLCNLLCTLIGLCFVFWFFTSFNFVLSLT